MPRLRSRKRNGDDISPTNPASLVSDSLPTREGASACPAVPLPPLHPPLGSICSRLVPDHHPIRTNRRPTQPCLIPARQRKPAPPFRHEHLVSRNGRGLGALPVCCPPGPRWGTAGKRGKIITLETGRQGGKGIHTLRSSQTTHVPFWATCCVISITAHTHTPNPPLPLSASPHQKVSVLHPVQLPPCPQARYKYAYGALRGIGRRGSE